jgi:hypothetical protein
MPATMSTLWGLQPDALLFSRNAHAKRVLGVIVDAYKGFTSPTPLPLLLTPGFPT